MARFWPLTADGVVTSPYGPRAGGTHRGVDFGRPGGSAGMPVHAVREGRVLYAGAAQGYGGPDPAGWLVILSPDGECWEYGHIVREVGAGDTVTAGQRIARINPDRATNANVDPHLHVSFMPNGYDPNTKRDPLPLLQGAKHPGSEAPVTGWQGDPTWLEDVLKAKLGDRLVVHNNWHLYGTGNGPGGQMGDIWGVMMHHTGNANEKPEIIRNGVTQAGGGFLRGPLSQCLITPDGKCHLVAIGPCNHAGNGTYPGLGTNNGNQRTIGIECAWPTIRPDGSYDPGERWPDAQIITMREVAAAIVKRLGYGADRVIAHKEYAGASQGKWDPGNLDMGWFRGEVTKDLRGEFTKPTPPPEPPATQPPPVLKLPRLPFEDRELLEEILRQQRGPYLKGWKQLDDKTVVDSLADLHRKVDRIADALDIDLTEAT